MEFCHQEDRDQGGLHARPGHAGPQVRLNDPGFRRRVLIEPRPAMVTARLEDDWHEMAVTLQHHDGVVTKITSVMVRAPWTICPGAMERLEMTFTGMRLADCARRGEKTQNCTHLYDLAVFAAAHADEAQPTAYEAEVADPGPEQQSATLRRNGTLVLQWDLADDRLVRPQAAAGRRLNELGDWIAGLDRDTQEAARLLRWAAMMSAGRRIAIADHSSGARFASGSCFTLQPYRAEQAARLPGAHRDLSAPGHAPLADRAAFFVHR